MGHIDCCLSLKEEKEITCICFFHFQEISSFTVFEVVFELYINIGLISRSLCSNFVHNVSGKGIQMWEIRPMISLKLNIS